MHRAPSSISRELRRNGWRAPEPAAKQRPGRPVLAGGYPCAARPAARPSSGKHGATACQAEPARAAVGDGRTILREQHSPEQIAGILRNINPDEPTLRASHETIYIALYALPRGQ
ncbi:MAG: IS30 family transposase, partial [Burkholderia sp.]